MKLLILITFVILGLPSPVSAQGAYCGLYDPCNPSGSQNAAEATGKTPPPEQAVNSTPSSAPALQDQVTTPQPTTNYTPILIGGAALLIITGFFIGTLYTRTMNKKAKPTPQITKPEFFKVLKQVSRKVKKT